MRLLGGWTGRQMFSGAKAVARQSLQSNFTFTPKTHFSRKQYFEIVDVILKLKRWKTSILFVLVNCIKAVLIDFDRILCD